MITRRQLLSAVSAAVAAGIITPAAAEVLKSKALTSKEVSDLFYQLALTKKMPEPLSNWLKDPAQQIIEPYRVFDNVWYVGIRWVAAYAIKTDDGVILIDTTHEPFASGFIDNLAKIGVDLKDIRWVLMTHGHFDHVGGAVRLSKVAPNARFVMSGRGWEESFKFAKGRRGFAMLEKPDVTLKDGESVSAGGTTVTLLETPGHTWGTSSYLFDVKDGPKIRRAVTIGGLGLNAISGPEQIDAYVDSMNRLMSDELGVEVDLTAHPFSIGMTEMIPEIKAHIPGGAHPLANREEFCRHCRILVERAVKLKADRYGKA